MHAIDASVCDNLHATASGCKTCHSNDAATSGDKTTKSQTQP